MWLTSLYIWLVICSKTHVTCIPCSDKKIADDLPQDMAGGWQGQEKILASYNPFDTPPNSPRNSKIETTENSFWLQCVLSLFPLFGASPEPQITRESDSGFIPHTKYVVSWPRATDSPNIHWVSNKSFHFWWELMELLQILEVEGSRLSSVHMPAMRSRLNHACDQITKMGSSPYFGVHDPIFKFNNSLEPVADL